jgi:hypothetical protein
MNQMVYIAIRYIFKLIFRKKLMKKAYMYWIFQGISHYVSFKFAKKKKL